VKAYLLAAGEGRRLRPLTERVPKCLVPFDGTPLLGIWLQLLEVHGVRAALVNTHHLPAEVEAFVKTWPTSVEVTTVHEPRLLGSAGTVLANRAFVAGEDSFLVVYADNLAALDVGRMIRFHQARPEPMTIGVVPTDRPREKGTVVLDEGGRIIAFDEKVDQPRSNLSNAGVYVADPELFDAIAAAGPREVLDFGHHVLPLMVPHVAAYPIQEFIADIGTPEAYADAQAAWRRIRQANPPRAPGHTAP